MGVGQFLNLQVYCLRPPRLHDGQKRINTSKISVEAFNLPPRSAAQNLNLFRSLYCARRSAPRWVDRSTEDTRTHD